MTTKLPEIIAEMRKMANYALTDGIGAIGAKAINIWADQLEALAQQPSAEAVAWASVTEKYGVHKIHYGKPDEALELRYWKDQFPDGGKVSVLPLYLHPPAAREVSDKLVLVDPEVLRVAATALHIASDWNVNEMEIDAPISWNVACEDEEGWISTRALARYIENTRTAAMNQEKGK